jgi:hypothetical protein
VRDGSQNRAADDQGLLRLDDGAGEDGALGGGGSLSRAIFAFLDRTPDCRESGSGTFAAML